MHDHDLQKHLLGRHLLSNELPFSMDAVQNAPFVEIEQGVVKKSGFFYCNRCGNDQPFLFAGFDCARCKKFCHYCRNCIMMGRVSECSKLVSFPRREKEEKHSIQSDQTNFLQWDGELSPAQKRASDRIAESVLQRTDCLIWAVCGAGKTEVLFAGINTALQKGLFVCIAAPRTDVVLELGPRLKNVFPSIDVAVLYGGSEDRLKLSPITISTTHQLLRYKEAFDVVILDEVDAFPYSVDSALQFAVEKARKRNSSLIYLTATPSSSIKQHFKPSEIVKIPARYHGYPLPVPEFKWCGNWKKRLEKGKLPKNIITWAAEQMQKERQAFLFVPEIKVLHDVVPLLKKLNSAVEGVHAEDPQRKEKVRAFRNGRIPIIVTTTILERGVTVPGTDAAVLGAEETIFTESALVQISGRVGRSMNNPTGSVIFFHYGKTNEMIAAKHHILAMNREAAKEDLLKR